MADSAFLSGVTSLNSWEMQFVSADDRDEPDFHTTDIKLPVRKSKDSDASDDGCESDFDSTLIKSLATPVDDSDTSHSDDETPPPFSELTNDQKYEFIEAVKNLQKNQEAIKKLQQQHEQSLKDLITRQPSLPKMFNVMRKQSQTPESVKGICQTDQFLTGPSGYETQSQTTIMKNLFPYDKDEIYVHLEQVYTNLRALQSSARSIKGVLGTTKVHSTTYYNLHDLVKRENHELKKKIAMLEGELRSKKPPGIEGPTPIWMNQVSTSSKTQRGHNELYSILPSKDIVLGRPTPPLPLGSAPLDIRATEVTFKWTISDYSKKLRDEKSRGGKQFSSPFYLSHCGYRAQMEAYLNGNGTAAHRCMSVFLRVIKGEYDRTLKWPVNLHMVVILINQSGQNMECLKAGGHQFQFMQPQGNADSETDCWGLIEFVSHEMIRRRDYIFNDKIVIKCRLMILP